MQKMWVTNMRFANIKKTIYIMRKVPFVFTQKTNKFWFVANGTWTIHTWCSACSQSHLHIHTFCTSTVRKQFGSQVCTSLNNVLSTRLVRIAFVDEAHLINKLSMCKYKFMSLQKSGIKYDFEPLKTYIFVNLPSNWKVIR